MRELFQEVGAKFHQMAGKNLRRNITEEEAAGLRVEVLVQGGKSPKVLVQILPPQYANVA